jgi:hypothetical protein
MPADPPHNDPSSTPAAGDPAAVASPAEQITAERTERRRQRAAAHQTPTSPGAPRRARRRERPSDSRTPRTPPRRMSFRDSVSVTLIAMLVAGGALGAILGALSVPGWVIGVLAAGLTVVLAAVARRSSAVT